MMQNLEIEDLSINVHKPQDQTSLNPFTNTIQDK